MLDTENTRPRNNESGSSGSGTRPAMRRNATKARTPTMPTPRTSGEIHG